MRTNHTQTTQQIQKNHQTLQKPITLPTLAQQNTLHEKTTPPQPPDTQQPQKTRESLPNHPPRDPIQHQRKKIHTTLHKTRLHQPEGRLKMSPQEPHSLIVVNIQRQTNNSPCEPTHQKKQQLFKTYVKYMTQDCYTQNHLYRLKNIVVVKHLRCFTYTQPCFSPDGGTLT